MNIAHALKFALASTALAGLAMAAQPKAVVAGKPRIVITADPELDDNNTLIRMILYTTDYKIEGLVYTSSEFHWKGDGTGTTQYVPGREYGRMKACLSGCTTWRWPDKPEEAFIDHIVDAYEKAYPNLKVHDRDYPTPAALRSKIAWGNIDFEGDYSKDTAGSNLIKKLLLDDQPGPLYVTAQGGQNTIARALKSIYDQYHATPQWNAIYSKVSHKLVIMPSGDQDGVYPAYIKPNWPDVEYVQLSGGANLSYGARVGLTPQNLTYLGPEWTKTNVLDRGPLGALYRTWGDGRSMVSNDMADYFALSGYTADQLRKMGYTVWTPPQPKGSFIGEGDDPTFIDFVGNGLRAYQSPTWGGWGGVRQTGVAARPRPPIRTNTPDDPGKGYGLAPAGVPNPQSPNSMPAQPSAPAAGPATAPTSAPRTPSPRTVALNNSFFVAAQNDFAARLKWAVTPAYKDANHEPVVVVKGALDRAAHAGETVSLDAQVSDPDHDPVTIRWWQYNDAETYPGDIAFSATDTAKTEFKMPADIKPGETVHVVIEATDGGTPALTHYGRVIITAK